MYITDPDHERMLGAEWLRDLDSNQDNILQRDAYYHYTIPQMVFSLLIIPQTRAFRLFGHMV